MSTNASEAISAVTTEEATASRTRAVRHAATAADSAHSATTAPYVGPLATVRPRYSTRIDGTNTIAPRRPQATLVRRSTASPSSVRTEYRTATAQMVSIAACAPGTTDGASHQQYSRSASTLSNAIRMLRSSDMRMAEG